MLLDVVMGLGLIIAVILCDYSSHNKLDVTGCCYNVKHLSDVVHSTSVEHTCVLNGPLLELG